MKVGRHQIGNRPKRGERHRRCQEKARRRQQSRGDWQYEGAYRLLWLALFLGLVTTFVVLWRPR